MFFQRRRLQVLLSVLVILASCLFLLGELRPDSATSPSQAHSQLSEAMFYLRHNYVRQLDEAPLLESAVAAVKAEAVVRGLPEQSLPNWDATSLSSGDQALGEVEQYIDALCAVEESKLARQEAVYIALAGMLSSLSDPYTYAMDPKAYAKFSQSLHTHAYGGVGIELEWTKGAYVVFEVAPNSPAAVAAILPGDRLLEVDGVELSPPGRPAVTLEQARALLVGEVSKEIKLTLARGGASYRRTLKLGQFVSRSVKGRLVGDPAYGEPVVGWLTVTSLGEESGQEMLATVSALAKKGAEGYVIDLRDNVGGYLNAAAELASIWLPSGLPVVTVEGRSAEKSKHTISASHQQASLVVLVNGRTASSAEILAACLREHGRAYLLGDRTFGKGSVQTLYDFVDGGGFKMTTATYLTPSGKTLEGRGLTPDRRVDVSQGRDEAAIQLDVLQLCGELWKKEPTEP